MDTTVTYLSDGILRIALPEKVNSKIADYLTIPQNAKIVRVEIDFELTRYVTLAGSMFLICYTHLLTTSKAGNLSTIDTEIFNISEDVVRFLKQFGFFRRMNSLSNLLVDKEELLLEDRMVEKRFKWIQVFDPGNSLVMPIEIMQSGPTNYYETYLKRFMDRFSTFFDALSKVPRSNFLNDGGSYQKDYSLLSNTLTELIKNIYDHSHSWGIGGIHASSNLGTQIAFFDVGLGIASTVRKLLQNSDLSEPEALRWAVVDGNTSKPTSNQGKGFTTMRDIADEKRGTLVIRSGNYIINTSQKGLNPTPCNWFPGTQIVLFIPSIKLHENTVY